MIVASEYMNQVFHKDHAAFRRKWLDDYVHARRNLAKTVVSEIDPSITTADYEVSQQSVRDFFSQELILFNEASCGRNLPRRDDGLKLSQRKIIYSALTKPLPYSMVDPLKVSQFCGYVAEHTQYHYGDKALNDAIVRLAQSYVGSNNIPLLFPEGNFGSRDDNGNDAAASRYIHTKQNVMTRLLFREEDDAYLADEWDDGHSVEKREYLPILPMLLVNGAAGVATGWSTKIPPHNPVVLANWIRVWLDEQRGGVGVGGGGVGGDGDRKESVDGQPLAYPVLQPWWRGHRGRVEPTPLSSKFMIWGCIVRLPAPNLLSKTQTAIQVTELPIGVSIRKYRKDVLEKMRERGQLEFLDHSDSCCIDFKVLLKGSTDVDQLADDRVMLLLKLRSWSTQQLVCLTDYPTEIKRYERVEDILVPYCVNRLGLFETVLGGEIGRLVDQVEVEISRRRFVQAVVDKVIVLNEYDDDGLEVRLEQMGFRVDPVAGRGYAYLTEMPVRSMTLTRIGMLDAKIVKLNRKLEELRASTAQGMWRDALDEWERVWVDWLAEAEPRVAVVAGVALGLDGGKGRAVGGGLRKKKK